MRLRRTPFVSALAILLVALNALWPLIAQARPRASGVLVPLCTIDGVTHYTELPAPKSPLEHSEATREHCKMCVFGGERAFLPYVPLQILANHDGAIAPRTPQAASAARSFDFRAHPRAPPLSSGR